MFCKNLFSVISLALFVFIGNTAFAGCPSADLTGDCFVDNEDFAQMGGQWLNGYDSNDLIEMALQWLVEGIPEVWVYIDELSFNGEMSKYETTNYQYCQFLNDVLDSNDITVNGNYVVGTSGPYSGQNYYNLSGAGYTYNGATNGGASRINWTGSFFTVDSGFEKHPVTHVSWYGATAFSSYYGWRLPTEWEWHAVADYDGSYTYGCGTSINNSIANYYSATHPYGTTVVGSFGTYGYGMCDMAGNVWEWTSSCWHPDCPDANRVLRSGAWDSYQNRCTVSTRSTYPPNGAYSIGFRVCR